MARKKTVNTVRELAKVLAIDGQDYQINAEKATKVENQLLIKETIDTNNTVEKPFDGSAPIEISVVPSTGGRFSNPIKVPHVENSDSVTGETILNIDDTLTRIAKLTGSGWYTWENNTLTIVKNDNEVTQHLGIVVGNEIGLESFMGHNIRNKWLPMFLYICSDTGNIFYGWLLGTPGYTRLATKANTSTASDFAERAGVAYRLNSPDSEASYTSTQIAQLFDEIFKAFDDAESDLTSKLTTVYNRITIVNNKADNTEARLEDVINGNTKVGKASQADNATNATSATKDGEGNIIHNKYYQSKSNSSKINSITISTSSPSGGNDGDIWIKYS